MPLTDGTLGLEEPGGVMKQAALSQGVPYSRRVGVNHNVSNLGDAPLAFLEIESTHDHAADRRRAVLSRFMAAWNARDVDALMGCMADPCAFHSSATTATRQHGRDAVRAGLAQVFDIFPQAVWTEARHHVSGDTGLCEWRFTGTTRKGRNVDVQGCDILRFDGDLIASVDSYVKARAPG